MEKKGIPSVQHFEFAEMRTNLQKKLRRISQRKRRKTRSSWCSGSQAKKMPHRRECPALTTSLGQEELPGDPSQLKEACLWDCAVGKCCVDLREEWRTRRFPSGGNRGREVWR